MPTATTLARRSDSDALGTRGDAHARGSKAHSLRSGALENAPGAPRTPLSTTGSAPEVPSGPGLRGAAPLRPGAAGPSLDKRSFSTKERTAGSRRAERASRAAANSAWGTEKSNRWYRYFNARVAVAMEKVGLDDDADRVRQCGNERLFVDPNGHTRWGHEQCEHRLCPRCARRRSKKMGRAWADAAERVPKRRGYRWRLVTLTLLVGSTQGRLFGLEAGTQDLMADFVRIKDCFARLRRRWRNRDRWEGLAGFYALEVGELVTGRNVHIHMLVYTPYLPQAELSEEWLELTGDSMIVDVRLAYDDLRKAVKEITKYITKLTLTRDVDELVAIHLAMRGKPTGRPFGLAHGTVDVLVTDPIACKHCGSTTWYYVADGKATANGEQLATELALIAELAARAGPPLTESMAPC